MAHGRERQTLDPQTRQGVMQPKGAQRYDKHNQSDSESDSEWVDAGQGWWGRAATLRLHGWSRQRKVVVLRRKIKENINTKNQDIEDQLELLFGDASKDRKKMPAVWEYAVLVTSADAEIMTINQLYRDRADSENTYDELENQWGWGGFATQDIKRCGLMVRCVALIYNWWSLFVRLGDPTQHREAIRV